MVRVTPRVAACAHRCECGRPILRGDRFLEHVISPDHDGLGNTGWWRAFECGDCAERYGRGDVLEDR